MALDERLGLRANAAIVQANVSSLRLEVEELEQTGMIRLFRRRQGFIFFPAGAKE